MRDPGPRLPPEAVWSIALAAAPFVVAVFRLYVVESRGDINTFQAIVASADLGAVWITVAVSTLTATAPIIFLFWWYRSLVSPRVRAAREAPEPSPRGRRSVATAALLGVVVAAAISWLLVYDDVPSAISVAILFGVIVYASGLVADRSAAASARWPRFVYGWGWLAAFLVIGFLSAQPGFPYEAVKIRAVGGMLYGYVVSVDDTSVTLLYDDLDRSGGLRRIPTGDVEARYVCSADAPRGSPFFSPTTGLERLISAARQVPPYVPEQCLRP
ncbi:hypothetical protein ACR9E3_30055 [Actinomycetospora sp. C-140]